MTKAATNIFRDSLLRKEEFTTTFELVPGRGSGGKRLEKILTLAELAKNDGRIKAFSITDNPGGHPALSPTSLGLDIQAMGISPLLHFSLKDKNRNMAESQLFECHRHDLLNILVLGGDYPRHGFQGQAMPVFDLDSIQLLDMICKLRSPLQLDKGVPGQAMDLPSMDFFAGCVVSPFKTTEAEQVWQYVKMLSKIQSGASFVITQLGYDMAKYKELIDLCHNKQTDIPLIANVFIPSLTVARIMNRGKVPGVLLPDTLLQQIEKEQQTSDKGKESSLLRAAQMIAALRQMGYDGVHIGGNNLTFDDLSFLLGQAENLYTYPKDDKREIHFPVAETWYLHSDCTKEKRKQKHPFIFFANELIHRQFFTPEGFFFPLAKKFSLFVLQRKRLEKIYSFVEHLCKKLLFHCRMCGDCTLSTSAYICPQSGCPKKMINGPCGGSNNGYCEVYPNERICFWVRSFQRGKNPVCSNIQPLPVLPPKDWSLNRSSSWLNYFSGKDHCQLEQTHSIPPKTRN